MSASSRFGYSMFTGALVSGALVGWESINRRTRITANAAAHHVSQGSIRLSAFIGLALIAGLVLFVVATAVHVRRRPQRRLQRQAAPAPRVRQRSSGGYR
jgi:uncharacterized iron-regulated membrane protein